MNWENRKLTAVHKMAIDLEAEIGQYVPRDKVEYIRLIISNAKALEKEQIIDAFNYARYRLGDSSDYYHETYESYK